LSCIMPMVQWSGTRQAVDFYREMLDEVKALAEAGKGPVPDKRFRLLYDNIPPWFTLGLFNFLHNFKAVSVIETYTRFFHLSRGAPLDPHKPYESLVRKYLHGCFYMTSVQETVHDIVAKLCREYQVDGIIIYILYGCKISSGFLPYQRHVMEKQYVIPTLILEGDMVDPRDYADAQVKNRIEGFMELLAARKQKQYHHEM